MKCQRLAALVLIGTLAFAPACATVQTNPTQTAQQQTREIVGKVLKAVQQTAIAMRGIQDLEISLHQGGIVTDADHKKIQQAFLIAFQTMDVLVVQTTAATTMPQLRTTLLAVKGCVGNLAAALTTSAPNASKALQTAAESLALAIDVALALIGV